LKKKCGIQDFIFYVCQDIYLIFEFQITTLTAYQFISTPQLNIVFRLFRKYLLQNIRT